MSFKTYGDDTKKDRLFVLIAAGMILPAAFLFTATLNLPHVLIICLLGLAISLISGRPVRYSDRSIIYSIVIAVTLAVLFDLVFPVDKNRFILLGDIFSTNITAPFLLYMAVMMTFFSYTPYNTGVVASFSIFAMMLSSDVNYNSTQQGSFLLIFDSSKNYVKIFSAIVIIEVIFVLIALQPRRISDVLHVGKWKKRMILLFSVIFVAMIGLFSYYLFKTYEDEFHTLESYFFRMGMRHYHGGRNYVFTKEISLNRTLSPEVGRNKNVIVLRAESEIAPGYLRGRVYTRYNNGKWTNPGHDYQKLSFASYEGMISIKTFFHSGGEKVTTSPVNVYPASNFYSDVLLVPGNSVRFDIVADRLSSSDDGILIPEEWQKDGGYTTFAEKYAYDGAYPMPRPETVPNLTYLPDSFTTELNEIIKKEVLGKSLESPEGAMSDSEFADRVLGFFHSKFKYSLDFNPETAKGDPALYFMEEARSGHCELFATSAILLLRKQGIPARYVTGFICEEQHPSKKYYVARLGNAHAWVEAYLRDKKKWVLLEPTPASGFDSSNSKWSLEQVWDRIKHIFESVLSDMRRGYFAKAVAEISTSIYLFVKDMVWHPLRGPIFLILFVFLYYFRGKIFRRRGRHEYSENIILLRREFFILEKFVAKKWKIVRPKNATVQEWAESFRDKGELPAKFADLALKYQELRYAQKAPLPGTIGELRYEINELIRKAKN